MAVNSLSYVSQSAARGPPRTRSVALRGRLRRRRQEASAEGGKGRTLIGCPRLGGGVCCELLQIWHFPL
ncbi:Hypothetical predicted protein [Podarcis lilfordi]|uniref:Uncharacterized protein n=1 Tax=Podarcis lilfordi TaxID=74358 RepID=A0AA35PGF2_9SAUR|nr:Hypothetical predicted protein [Podarcis lilfordi]